MPPFKDLLLRLRAAMPRFLADRTGNVSVIMALSMTGLIGAAGMGVEVGLWYLERRNMQHAADAAAIAAATNGGAYYLQEARAVASQYGFTHGADNISVAAVNNAACPSGGSNCYKVTISGSVPLFLSPVVGFTGDTVVNGSQQQTISVNALAQKSKEPHPYCILALTSSGETEGIRANGVPKSNLAGCNLMSNTNATCNGHNTGADIGDAHGTNNGCGVQQNSSVDIVTDPYVGLASNIPTDPCSGVYPQAPDKNKDDALPSSNLWSGAMSWSGNYTVCGDLQLTGDVGISSISGAVLVIFNGSLILDGHTLKSLSGTGLTIVFAGTNSASYDHAPIGSGTLDFAAPTSGPWSGVAIYQAPSLTVGTDITEAGNSPTWNITGLVYLPHSSVTLSGAINKSSNGQSCFGLVVDNIRINGTGAIFAYGACPLAGLTLPTGLSPGRGALVN